MAIVPVPFTISSFRDALGLAFELSDEFAFAQAAVLIDRQRRCVDFGVFTEVGQGLTPALGWLSRRVDHHRPSLRALFISVRSVNGLIVAEHDLAEFRFAVHTAAQMGVSVIDWLETDGELVRSYAYLTNPNTVWSMQAAAEGAVDCSDW